MSSPRNEYDFAKEFTGNLRSESAPVPARVNTRLRVVMKEEAKSLRDRAIPVAPRYIIGIGGELPIHPSLQAMGRHYFTW